ncbi:MULTISPECIES: hypothetical protein [Bacillus cereus group]|uniref:hypothetical protein n=1 Tax=Bacillus cereus group TaxID=86661 RepID=UPI001D0F0FAA|nr:MULTISPECIES: hypothetical protein [Bacillus cereus group]MCC2326653.1 hypothetical protein [Bacillus wiedmannii]MED1020824.1 hypothetical protein [Bacillus mycoides]
MADARYNLKNLFNIYKQAEKETKTIIFESHIGRGRFLFMSFFADDDESTKDTIFLYLRNTNNLVSTKLYGNHSKGDFYIYPNKSLQEKLVKELQLKEGSGTFSFSAFMEQFNESIPENIPSELKAKLMRENLGVINQTGAIDEAEKIHLLSVKKLNIGTPQDKTLRKLYMYTENNSEDIELFIKILKKINYTTVWGKMKPQKNVNIQEWINRLS